MKFSLNPRILHQTVSKGTINEILKLLQDNNINSIDRNDPILHLIFKNENIKEEDAVKFLKTFLAPGIDPYIKNEDGLTVLHHAVDNRWKNAVDILIQNKTDAHQCDNKGNSLLQYFIENENRRFRTILESDGSEFETPIDVVKKIEDESTNFVEMLINKGFVFDCETYEGGIALYKSIQYNLFHIVVKLLEHYKECLNKVWLQLFFEKNSKFKKTYCDSLAEIESKFRAKKRYAVFKARHATNIVKMFIERGVTTRFFAFPDETYLQTDITHHSLSDTEIDKTLIELDVMLSGFLDQTCLQTAILHGDDTDTDEINIIRILFDDNSKSIPANKLATDLLSWMFETPQFFRLQRKTGYFITILYYLINRGADLMKDGLGAKMIYYSTYVKNHAAIVFLSNYYHNFNEVTYYGENLFHALARMASYDESYEEPAPEELKAIFDFLVSNGCQNVNAWNRNADTPLHLAYLYGNTAVIEKLREHGAEVNFENEDRVKPEQMKIKFQSPNCTYVESIEKLLTRKHKVVRTKTLRTPYVRLIRL